MSVNLNKFREVDSALSTKFSNINAHSFPSLILSCIIREIIKAVYYSIQDLGTYYDNKTWACNFVVFSLIRVLFIVVGTKQN